MKNKANHEVLTPVRPLFSMSQQAMCILILVRKDMSLFIPTGATNTSRSLIWCDQGWSHLTKKWAMTDIPPGCAGVSHMGNGVHIFVGGPKAFQG